MKQTFYILVFLVFTTAFPQAKLLTWNLENFGKSKTEQAISSMVAIIKNYDVVAIQEVVAGSGGAQAVAKLADELNRKGDKWDYIVSGATSGSPYKSERYAYLWKTANIKRVGKAALEQNYHAVIEREPYMATFEYKKEQFTVVSYHAITKKAQPETEIKYFKLLPALYPKDNLVFVGDFNCPQSHTVFQPLRQMGYASVLINQKTSLRMKCINNDCLASEFDNIWYDTRSIQVKQSKVLAFFTSFATLKEARTVSDHCPVGVELYFGR
jgi:deoxyribonuclease-1-like protein